MTVTAFTIPSATWRLVGGIADHAPEEVRATAFQIADQLRTSRLTGLSKYGTKRATQRESLLHGGTENLRRANAFIQEEQERFVTDRPAIHKGKSGRAGSVSGAWNA